MGRALLRGHFPTIVLRLLLTNLPVNSITFIHVYNVADFSGYILAALFRDLSALLLGDGVAGLPVDQVHHSPLLGVTVLHGARHRHLDGVARLFGHVVTLLVVHGVTLVPGYHIPLGLVFSVADVLEMAFTHRLGLVVAHGLGHCVALGLVLGVTLGGSGHSTNSVVTLLNHGVVADIPGDGVALGGSGVAAITSDVGAMKKVNKEKRQQEDQLHSRLLAAVE